MKTNDGVTKWLASAGLVGTKLMLRGRLKLGHVVGGFLYGQGSQKLYNSSLKL